jgi:protein-S-isoprenylcysteine O-methyltransferase Ste14
LKQVQEWVFKWRGALLIPPGLCFYLLGRPTPTSFTWGVLLALTGEAVRIWGVGYSGVTTRKDVVVAPRLTTAGPYAYVRNPLYVGNCITAFGFLVAASGGLGVGVKSVLFLLLVGFYGTVYGLIVPHEEAYLRQQFGQPFQRYCQLVPRWIPSLVGYPEPEGEFDAAVILKAETHTLGLLLLAGCLLFLKMNGWDHG